MKKNIGKILIIMTLMFSLGNTNVKAKAIEKNEQFSKEIDKRYTVNGMTIGSKSFNLLEYTFTDPTGENFTGYCMDPHKDSANGYKTDRILGDPTKSLQVRAFDLGIIEIMKNGYNQYNKSYTFQLNGASKTVSGDSLYAATSIAIRTYSLGVFGYGGDIDYGRSDLRQYFINEASVHITRGIQWGYYASSKVNNITKTNCSGTEAEFKKCYADSFIRNKLKNTWYNSSVDFGYKKSTESYDVIYAAQSLFYKGIDKANEVMTGNVSSATINTSVNASPADKEINGDTINEYYYSELSFEKFSATSGTINNVSLTCQDCAKNGITLGSLEVYHDGFGWETLSSNTNILTYFTAENGLISGKLQLRFKVTRIKDNENCNSTSYKINYNYSDPSLTYTGALLKTNSTSKQRFFILQKVGGQGTGSLSGTIKCGVSCDTELQLPVCSTNEEDAVAKIDGPSKIKSCVIDNQDDAGNSYQFTSEAGGVDNAYCKVYCKEDYAEIKLNPIVQNVKCGGYFKLTSKINGTKTCYTGGNTTDKSINKDQFVKDIIQAQQQMIDKYNEYYRWKQSLNFIEVESNKYNSKSEGESCSTDKDGNEHCHRTCDSYADCDGYNVDMTESSGVRGYTISCNNTTGVCTYAQDKVLTNSYGEDGGRSGACYNGKCRAGKESTLKSNIQSKINSAKKELDTAIKAYEKIINDYNSCTTAWTNEFAFAQKVKYYYDENRGKNNENYAPYYDLLDDKEDLKYLEKYGNEKVETKISVCTGATDEAYNCLNNAEKTFDLSIDKNKLSTYSYNTSYGDVFEHLNYIKCSDKSCAVDTKSYVSKATFVKKEVTKEQNYITPTAFYQIAANGKVIAYDDYKFDKIQLEPLENKLPISTSSVGGGVFKLLVENLGEFYGEKNVYGRLIDFNQKNETKSVAYTKGVDTFNGEYTCYYKNTCRPKDCPNCDFVCEGDGCEWKDCPTCNFTCENCIFNLGELNVNVKTITTTNVNAANRTHGYNWITTSSMESLNLLTKKAATTISEIESANEMIYDDKTTDGSTLAFSIKLTPDVISKITKYNSDNEASGGYLNNSLTCYDATIDDKTYKNIYCYSELIDKLVEENGDNVTVLPSRVNDEARRLNDTESSGYWTLWTNYKIDKTSESVIGGPSWK